MGTLSKDEKLKLIGERVNFFSLTAANEEITAFEKANPNELVTEEIKATVRQRSTSELMFRSCNFLNSNAEADAEEYKDSFNEWYSTNEDAKLRAMCRSAVKDEIAKNRKPDEENLTFTEKYLRQVKESWKRN